jgi:hypothetical protein
MTQFFNSHQSFWLEKKSESSIKQRQNKHLANWWLLQRV